MTGATPAPRHRIDADPETVERGLVTLVLTLVELLRQLMERQALRRVDEGSLTDDQVQTEARCNYPAERPASLASYQCD